MKLKRPWWFYFILFFAGCLALSLQATGSLFAGNMFYILGSLGFLFGLFSLSLPEALLYSIILTLGYFAPLLLRNLISQSSNYDFLSSLLSAATVTYAIALFGNLVGFSTQFLFKKLSKKLGPHFKGRTTFKG